MESPRISVIIPVYNHAKYLPEAIESVLAQTLAPYELIVVDDGSTDHPELGLERYGNKIQFLRQLNQGIGSARNTGIQRAEGDYLSFLDADDFWSGDKLEKQIEFLRRQPELDMVFGMLRQFLSPDLDKDSARERVFFEEPMPGYNAGTLLLSRKTFLKIGWFRSDVKIGEFIDWYARSQEAGLNSAILPQIVYHRRIHSQNQGIRAKEHRRQYLHVLKASLDRRRHLVSTD